MEEEKKSDSFGSRPDSGMNLNHPSEFSKKGSVKSAKFFKPSSKSSRSRKSIMNHSTSTRSSVFLAKIAEAEAKLKEAEIAERYLVEKQQHQREQRVIEEKIELLDQKQETEKSAAKLEVLTKYAEQENSSGTSDISSEPGLTNLKNETMSQKLERMDVDYDKDFPGLPPRAPNVEEPPPRKFQAEIQTPFKSVYVKKYPMNSEKYVDLDTGARKSQNLIPPPPVRIIKEVPTQSNDFNEALINCISRQQAPECELEAFDGNPLNFHLFIKQFEDVVESKITDQAGRLNRLIRFTSGTVRELVKAYLYEPKEFGYISAKDMLEKEYGNPYTIAIAYSKEIRNLPVMKFDNGALLQKFHLFLLKMKICCQRNDVINAELNTQENIRTLAQKLTFRLQDSWNRLATSIWKSTTRTPHLGNFVNFVKTETDVATNPCYSRSSMQATTYSKDETYKPRPTQQGGQGQSTRPFRQVSAATDMMTSRDYTPVTPVRQQRCKYCENTTHDMDNCWNFGKLDLKARQEFIGSKNLCFACLEPCSQNHFSRICKQRRQCKFCKRSHPSMLCDPSRSSVSQPQNDGKESSSTATPSDKTGNQGNTKPVTKLKSATTSIEGSGIAMNYVLVNIESKQNPGKLIPVYAFLDSLSNSSFISEQLQSDLHGEDECPERVTMTTMSGEVEILTTPVTGIVIHGINDQSTLKLPKLYCRKTLPVDGSDVFGNEIVQKWSHLQHLCSEIPKYDPNIPVGLILGNNVPRAMEPFDFIRGKNQEPYAVKTKFGWSVCGPKNMSRDHTSDNLSVKINLTEVQSRSLVQSDQARATFVVCNDNPSNEDLTKMLEKMYQIDFIERYSFQHTKSQEDFEFRDLMEQETVLINGHYQLPLPIRDRDNIVMPDNQSQAYEHAKRIRSKLLCPGNEVLMNNYLDFMAKLVLAGHARQVPVERLEFAEDGKFWFLNYLDVEQPNKPGKFRIVFNCSKKFQGISLNDVLIAGPTAELTGTLIGVLMRWRQEPYAVIGDIEKMFHQTRVPEEQRAYLRYYWWSNRELVGEPVIMEMNVHLFGASSSPSCSNFALRKTALDNQNDFPLDVVLSVLNNFYVDDLLKSYSSLEDGKQAVEKIRELCKLGGFNLTKFTATHSELLENIPEENCVKANVNLTFTDKSTENPIIEKALGIVWVIENDLIGFRIGFRNAAKTRRGFLSAISSIWDVLGIGAPFLLKGRKLLQKLCRTDYNWDDILPEKVVTDWQNWITSLYALEKVTLPRSFKPELFGSEVDCEIHAFSDASDIGYGVAIYIRLENSRGEITTSLIFGKSRVIPLDGESTPRSELVAAVMASEITAVLRNELEYEYISCHYWTDSMIVLGYLNNTRKRFKQFVANRVRRIKLNSDSCQWHHIESEINPSDHASRGLDAQSITNSHVWFTGPEFLKKPKSEWSINGLSETKPEVDNNDPELKKKQCVLSSKVKESDDSENPTTELIGKFSEWNKKKFVVANIQRMLYKEKRTIKVDDLENAQVTILKLVQRNHFELEMKSLESGKSISQSSVMVKLNPYLDNNGLLRVGGRLENSDLCDELKNPVILPKFDSVTDSIVRHFHNTVGHGGRNATLNEIRNAGFWILHANSKIRHIISKCVKCRHSRGKYGSQIMAPLPADRLTEAPPYTYVGVDLFGPFVVKNGRKEQKNYGVLFTCLVSRAVHLETAVSMETDEFINCLRRFIGRRGPIRLLRSDNGSNFVGANNELKKVYEDLNSIKITEYLLNLNCDFEVGFQWKFNTPASSHHGGVWERQIRSVRNLLESLMRDHPSHLTSKSLETLLIEIEGIINSRPLTVDFTDPENPVPLSPINLLTHKTKVVLPPFGNFDTKADLYSRRQWRRVQHLAQEFWTRYRKEYLMMLHERSKWTVEKRNFREGDIILLKDDSVARNDWPMARIVNVYPDIHGHVRSVRLQLSSRKFLERPITKVVLLVGVDE